ncbi:MAG TPA: hypothetical protein VK555_05025, partial [Terriglobales bacterium]|nr:hypothetical protein [Terriglobales bacterium]
MESGNPTSGWVFSSRNDTPIALHNLINRVIKSVLKEAGINYFTGLYTSAATSTLGILSLLRA